MVESWREREERESVSRKTSIARLEASPCVKVIRLWSSSLLAASSLLSRIKLNARCCVREKWRALLLMCRARAWPHYQQGVIKEAPEEATRSLVQDCFLLARDF